MVSDGGGGFGIWTADAGLVEENIWVLKLPSCYRGGFTYALTNPSLPKHQALQRSKATRSLPDIQDNCTGACR